MANKHMKSYEAFPGNANENLGRSLRTPETKYRTVAKC